MVPVLVLLPGCLTQTKPSELVVLGDEVPG